MDPADQRGDAADSLKIDRPRRPWSEEWGVIGISVGLGVLGLLAWLWLSGWVRRFGEAMSVLNFLLVAAVVGIACFTAWLRDWRTLRVLRRHLSRTRARKGRQ